MRRRMGHPGHLRNGPPPSRPRPKRTGKHWSLSITPPAARVGIATDNWLSDVPISQWYGITSDANGRVTELHLSWNNLSGEIPAWLGSLANLEWLYLSGNQLGGEIPAELGSLANLEGLYLGGNQLGGEIPAWLGSLVNLKELGPSGNQLSGEIPAELGSLANLERLYLEENQAGRYRRSWATSPTWKGCISGRTG